MSEDTHGVCDTTNLIRFFPSGATRDADRDKLDYEGFLSPLVLERYAQYLHKYRVQSDGQLRDSDNWQKMFGEKHFDVCMKSLLRHVIDVWKQHRGYKGAQSIEDSICGALFNLQAYLFKILKDKYESENSKS